MAVTTELHDYQVPFKDLARDLPGVGLFLPMGLGKSLIALKALSESPVTGHVLVVGPGPVVKGSWPREVEKHGFDMPVLRLSYDERGRTLPKAKRHGVYASVLSAPPSLCLCSRDLVEDLVCYYRDRNLAFPFPVWLIDELHGFKGPYSRRFRALWSARPFARKVIGLTGTPAPQSLLDLWSELYLIDGGLRLGPDYEAFRDRFFYPTYWRGGEPVCFAERPGAASTISALIGDVCFSAPAASVRLPPATVTDVPVRLAPAERAVYETLRERAVYEETDGTLLTPRSASALMAKLRQLASGAIYTGEGGAYEVVSDVKLDLLEQVVASRDTPVMVGYHFRSDAERIAARMAAAGFGCEVMDGTADMVERWNAGKIRVLLCQPQSVGCGLNLQEGPCATLVWFTLPWSLECYQQFCARLVRQGQTRPVQVLRLVCEGTVDERVLECIERKDVGQSALMASVRAAMAPAAA